MEKEIKLKGFKIKLDNDEAVAKASEADTEGMDLQDFLIHLNEVEKDMEQQSKGEHAEG